MSARVGFLAAVSLLFLSLATACNLRAATGTVPTVAGTANATIRSTSAATTIPAPTLTPPPPTVTPTATRAATPIPTATRSLLVAVPPSWEAQANVAVAALAPHWSWRVMSTANPQALLDGGATHAALVPDDLGHSAGQRPLALVAPFVSEWDDVTLQQAQQVQTEGHDVLAILPWQELSVTQRALTIEGRHVLDVDYPLQQTWSLHAAPQADEAARALAMQLELGVAAGGVKLSAVGDVMLDRELGNAIASGETGYPFAYVADVLQNADYTVGNLECAVGDSGEPVAKSYTFRAPPGAAQALAQGGFDLVSLANNHALDFGPQALQQGMALLEEQGVAMIGAGADRERAHRPHLVTLKGVTLAFLGYVNVPVEGRAPYFDTASWTAISHTPGLAWADPQSITSDVQNVVDDVDHVVVILHSGYEYVPSPSPEQVASARAAIDAGATLVIGHHAHILQGVEFRGKGAIVYGLGNFAFNINGPPETAILEVWLDKHDLRQLRFVPAVIQESGQPRLADGDEAGAIRRQIYSLSRFLN